MRRVLHIGPEGPDIARLARNPRGRHESLEES
jgi:hypothetical protein